MRFKLIESQKGNENRKIFNQAAKKTIEYFKSLREYEILELLGCDFNNDNITKHSSMYITQNGNILNATDYKTKYRDNDIEQVHVDIFTQAFCDKMRDFMQGTSAEHLLDKGNFPGKTLGKLFKLQEYCKENFNGIKLNSGTISDENNCYISMPGIPNRTQMQIIENYLWDIYNGGHKEVMIFTLDMDEKYPLESPEDVEYVIDRLNLYCRIGSLKESKE